MPGGPKGPESPGGPLFPINTKKCILRFNPNKLETFIASDKAGGYLDIHQDLVAQRDQDDQAVPVDLDVLASLGLLDLQIQLWQDDSTLYSILLQLSSDIYSWLINLAQNHTQDTLEKRGNMGHINN